MPDTVAVDVDLLERLLCDAREQAHPELARQDTPRVDYAEHDPLRRAIAVARMTGETATPRPHVWVVEHIAEHSLGDGVIGVFSTVELALDAVKALPFTESFRTRTDVVFTDGPETVVVSRQDIDITKNMKRDLPSEG